MPQASAAQPQAVSPTPTASQKALRDAVARHWGFSTLRPLQAPAMQAMLDGRDSLLVLPTGGGKSICYQAPAVVSPGLTIVVSPLIALMKDQVDSLLEMDIPAVQLDSSKSSDQRDEGMSLVRSGAAKMLFVSPERLANPGFRQWLLNLDVRRVAIDEAHCISHWGHDFRPEYRQLAELRKTFPKASFHGFTATATEQVRQDIIDQLGLRDPEVLVGNFDRPNLTYRVISRRLAVQQVMDLLTKHEGEAGIIYCISRREVDDLSRTLVANGRRAARYHAGMTPPERQKAQDAFIREQIDVMVATVAFGMGIDRSNIRFVIHTGMPKSIEHYQQETGRAGRDGLEAECVLLYSGADSVTWQSLIEKSAAEAGQTAHVAGALEHLAHMDRFARGAACRHRALVEYFGQTYESENCGGCDVCLGDHKVVADGQVIAQKILSAVARAQERFGAGHVISVLRGENTERIRDMGHDKLPTFGLLAAAGKAQLRDFIYQLIGQDVLAQEGAEYPILKLNGASWEVMRGKKTVRLLETVEHSAAAKSEAANWDGVDRGLFDALREFRKTVAGEQDLPPYIVFSDSTLRAMAQSRPSTLANLRMIHGIGDAKIAAFGQRTIDFLNGQCAQRQLTRDQPLTTKFTERAVVTITATRQEAFDMFRSGATIAAVAQTTGRKSSTVHEYLAHYIEQTRPANIDCWLDRPTYEKISAVVKEMGDGWAKPIFIALGETVSYDQIRLVIAHMRTQPAGAAAR